jgi:hypothetical protein
MGYRSDIAILVYPARVADKDEEAEKYDQLKVLMNTTYKAMFDAWSNHFEWRDHRRLLQFRIDDVKWYDSDPEIAAVMEFKDQVLDLGYEVEYVCIGEDYTDINVSYSDRAEQYLSVHRAIHVDL